MANVQNEVVVPQADKKKYRCTCSNVATCTFGNHGYIPVPPQPKHNFVLDVLTEQYNRVYNATQGPEAEQRVKLFRQMTAPHNSY